MHKRLPKIATALLLIYLTATVAQSQSSAPIRNEYVVGQLIGELSHVQPGVPFRVGLLLDHDPHWHTYWKSSATGYATSIDWDLPSGWTAGPISWPTPTTYEFQGMVEYVYEGKTVLMTTITPPDSYSGDTVEIGFTTDWLMCSDLCIPGGIQGSLELKVDRGTPSKSAAWSDLKLNTGADFPADPTGYRLAAWRQGASVVLEIQGELPESVTFFDDRALFQPVGKSKARFPERNVMQIQLNLAQGAELPESLTGVLAAETGWPMVGNASSLIIDLPVEKVPPVAVDTKAGLSAGLLLLAFVGGLILNLMPCVFPVLGIKIMGFVGQAGSSRKKIIGHGLVFTSGVLVSFWVLTTVLLILRSSGNQLGWGFQLQSPAFVLILAILLFAFALNMSGLFEFGQSAVGVGSELTGKSGLAGTFFSGILATVVATPCAAPFLAPALGAALTLPPATSFLVFTVIALGLSTPYLLLSAFPGLINRLPRPGPWMETFKQTMGFLLYATVAYLLWVLAGQLGNESLYSPFGLLKVLFSLVLVAFSLWIYGRWAAFHRPKVSRRVAIGASILVFAFALLFGLAGTKGLSAESASLHWEKWAPGKAEELSSQGKIVYVDFTARWCVTCQTNKAAVFSSRKVLESIEMNQVVLLKADWTNKDAAISEALQSFNRSAVPFNLVYQPGLSEPIILPELLTPGSVLKAIDPEFRK